MKRRRRLTASFFFRQPRPRYGATVHAYGAGGRTLDFDESVEGVPSQTDQSSIGPFVDDYDTPDGLINEHNQERYFEAKVYHGSTAAFSTADPDISGWGTHLGSLPQAVDRLQALSAVDSRGQESYGEPPEEAYIYQFDINPDRLLRVPDMQMWPAGEMYQTLVTQGVIPPDPAIEQAAQQHQQAHDHWMSYLSREPEPSDEDLDAYEAWAEEYDDAYPELPANVVQYVRTALEQAGYDGLVYRNQFESKYKSQDSYIIWKPLTPIDRIEVDTGIMEPQREDVERWTQSEEHEAGLQNLRELDQGYEGTSNGLDDARRWTESYPDGVHLGQVIPIGQPTAEDVRAVRGLFDRAGAVGEHVAQRRQPWVAVDLDGTLLSYEPGMAAAGVFGEPLEGAREAMEELKALGWRVSIFTARIGDDLAPEDAAAFASEIDEYLKQYDIPFDDVWVGRKPRADAFIDDRAVRFEGDWIEALRRVVEVGGDGVPVVEDGTVVEDDDGGDREAWALPETLDGEFNDFTSTDVPSVRFDRSLPRPPDKEKLLY